MSFVVYICLEFAINDVGILFLCVSVEFSCFCLLLQLEGELYLLVGSGTF